MDNQQINKISDEDEITMVDVLETQTELEEDAHAVLGPSDDKNCSYNEGYIRQALYACKTCCQEGTRAAICLACSLHCHEDHDLIELYTKRRTRCDCGNSKFGDMKCNLEPTKDPENIENKYNQNYDGVYCTCSRPYPDPEMKEESTEEGSTMVQCCICEDWYHLKHLNCDKSMYNNDRYEEITCSGCMKDHPFLWRYSNKLGIDNVSSEIETFVDVVKNECSVSQCTLPPKVTDKTGPIFWGQGWRNELCNCQKCKQMYKDEGIEFIADPNDSCQVYEKQSKTKEKESQLEKGMKALSSLDRVQQLNAIEEYNHMKDSLKSYLQKFAENKKVVRVEDIEEFFTGIKANKRPKVEVPSSCR